MKRLKTTLLTLFSVAAFLLLMMFNVTTTDEGFELTLCGETVLANDGECLEVEGEVTPRLLNYTGDPNHPLNCNHAGNGCVPCTSTPIPE
ncbi:hypothetical protein [Rhodohalobacter halophilus]|uniref:hypothetical protein n=1 Tax=Rhodohalobacter halophilus TaxID=1812810 RepID=UPI00083FA5F7|nr:hypothetical protein [Rhodohalobacter halophilus]